MLQPETIILTKEPIFLLGATAVGKSAVALALARNDPRFRGAAILAMDAMQVYRGADIGTGKPSRAEREEFSHGGLDLVDFGGPFDVARYVEHAAQFLHEQREAGRPVIVVGGTGLYFRALTQGLCEAPRGTPELREELQALDAAALRARLGRVDPGMLGRVDVHNPRRLARAIEVMETTGRSLITWQEETPAALVPSFSAIWLQRGKDELQARIEARVQAMFAAGWAEEVLNLQRVYSEQALLDFSGIGYRQIAEALGSNGVAGHFPSENLRRDICVATRQYAKRQLTWFAREPNLQVMTLSGPQLPALSEFPFPV